MCLEKKQVTKRDGFVSFFLGNKPPKMRNFPMIQVIQKLGSQSCIATHHAPLDTGITGDHIAASPCLKQVKQPPMDMSHKFLGDQIP